MKRLITGNAAAAWGARLAEVDYVPAFPITPQTEIIEALADWFARGELAGKFVNMDSEHSMVLAAGAAAATGVRVFSATSSQGLVYALEALYSVAGWRVPWVLANVSRGLAAPITLGPDHNDLLAARDAGCVLIHAETCQEVLDSILMAYRIAEDPRVCAPVIVNLDGFLLSFTREPVELPDVATVREFLPRYQPHHPPLRGRAPSAQGVAVLDGTSYSYFRAQLHLALTNALAVHDEVALDFERRFGRRWGVVDGVGLEDAETVVVIMGSHATKARAAVARGRARGRRIGLLRLRLIRPWPAQAITDALTGRRAVGVIDQNLSPGLGGVLFHEVAASLAASARRPEVLRSYVGGLGGKDLSDDELDHVIETLEDAPVDLAGAPTELLFTAADRAVVESGWRAAGKHPEEAVP